MTFRTQFTPYKPEIFFTDPGEEESLTQQHMAAECDINTIMSRYQSTGEITHIAAQAGEYGDFSEVTDYKTGIERLLEADALFMELPSSIRDRFNNDPAAFIEFASDPKNIEEMRKMGLAPPLPTPPEPQLVKVVSEDGDADAPPKSKPAKGDQ